MSSDNIAPDRTEPPERLGATIGSTIADFAFELLKKDGVLAYFRGRHRHGSQTILIAQAASSAVEVEAALQLHNEFALRIYLDPAWALKPVTSVTRHGSIALIYEDVDANPLDQRRPRLLDIDHFLLLAIGIAAALRHVHASGLLHKNVKPSNIMVDAMGTCRFTGFGLASRARYETLRNPANVISGTLAYMSPEHTGRTNRRIDARSDLYSLGVTFYELLTGRLPFEMSENPDSAEWVHRHIASEPDAPHLLLPGIPETLSLVVLKLLAKNPESRYQTAAGVEADLKRCRLSWRASRRIEGFTLGQHEQAAELTFPKKLYSREPDLQTLMAAFDHVDNTGTGTLAVISGESGVGKSALLAALLAELRRKRACLAVGKVDQYRRDVPYAVLAEAFQGLILEILGQSDSEVRDWKQRLTRTLGAYGKLAVNLVPELELLTGAFPPVSDLPAQEAQRRFHMVIHSLVSAFAAADRPLVLLIDDLQWIDPAAAHLLEHLMSSATTMPLLMVIAYRDTAANGEGLLDATLPVLRRQAARTYEIVLNALDVKAVGHLIADSLRLKPRDLQGLAALVHEKTAGNPFFVRQFMKTVVDDGLIVLDLEDGKWRCDLADLREREYTENVVVLVLQRLARLSVGTQRVLAGLACLGRHTGIGMLAAIHSMDEAELQDLLAPALDADVILLAADGYAFCHDRVQEASYALMPAEERQKLHLIAGRLLLDSALATDRDETLFRAVDHLGLATDLITNPGERLRIAEAGLLAAQKAKRAIAYGSALSYVHAALLLVPSGVDKAGSGFTFLLMLEQAECELICGNLPIADGIVHRLLGMQGSIVERAAAYRLKTEIHLRRSENALAVETALEGLRSFGIVMRSHPSASECELAYLDIRQRLRNDPVTTLLALPQMCNPDIEAAMALLSVVSVPASFTDDRLHFLQLCHTLRLTLDHGMTGASTMALAWFGVLVGHRYGHYADGFQYGQLARVLVSHHRYLAYEAKTILPLDQLSVWTQPLSFSIDCVKAGFAAGVANGDITTACFECCHQVANFLTRGDHLDIVRSETERGLAFVRQAVFPDVEAILIIQQRFVDNLRVATNANFTGDGLSLSDVAGAPSDLQERMSTLVFWYWLYKAISYYLAGEITQSLSCLAQAEQLAWSAPGHIHLLDYHLFYALALAADDAPADRHAMHRAAIQEHYEKIAGWAAINPATFADKEALVRAEIARLDGDSLMAITLYEKAIRHAEEQGFVQCAAYAYELAARLCTSIGHQTAAIAYLKGARDAYCCWGAIAKASQLERLYPERLETSQAGVHNTVSISETGESWDLDSVIRSVRALSEEIRLDQLIQTLMTIVLEHVGAQRGLLIRLHGNVPFIAARAHTTSAGIDVDLVQTAPTAEDLPVSMLHTVIRTCQRASITGVRQPSPFNSDPYLLQHPQCAAMCIPILNRAELVGVLYLENRLMPGAFTDEHARVLELLAAQAAISLEIARLYTDLMEENLQRQRVERALRASEASLELGEQISHTGSWRWDMKRDVLTCSAEFCRIFGLDPAQRILPFADFVSTIHPDDRNMVLDVIRAGVPEEKTLLAEYRIVRSDGAVRYLSGIGKPVSDNSESNDYVGTVTDITTRRAAEDALQVAQADLARVARATTVGQLTASIAHEINQPLMSIVSNGGASLRWLDRNPPELDEARASLQDIVSEAGRAGDIIQSLQALTRNCEPVLARVNLHDTVSHILAISRSELKRHAVSLQLSLEADTPYVLGDDVQLQQVLLNLVINAIDAMSEVWSRPRILSISSSIPEAQRIRICVEDTGVGLNPKAAEQVFEAFYTTKSNGMGMGLAICRSIIEAHHGVLRASRRQPHGSVFSFVLPILDQDECKPMTAASI